MGILIVTDVRSYDDDVPCVAGANIAEHHLNQVAASENITYNPHINCQVRLKCVHVSTFLSRERVLCRLDTLSCDAQAFTCLSCEHIRK